MKISTTDSMQLHVVLEMFVDDILYNDNIGDFFKTYPISLAIAIAIIFTVVKISVYLRLIVDFIYLF